MDVCPVQALDIEPPQPGPESKGPAGIFRASPSNGMMEYPVQVARVRRLRQSGVRGVPHSRRPCLDHGRGSHAAGGAPGPVSGPPLNRRRPGSRWARSPRNPLKRPRGRRGQSLFSWRNQRSPERLAGLGGRGPPMAAAIPFRRARKACPAGTDAGRYVRADRPGRYDEGLPVCGPEVNPFPGRSAAGSAPLRGEGVLPAGHPGRTIASAAPREFATEQASCPPVAPPSSKAHGEGRIVGGGPAWNVGRLLLAASALRITVLSRPMPGAGRMMAIGIPETASRAPCCARRSTASSGLGVDLKPRQAPWTRLQRWPILEAKLRRHLPGDRSGRAPKAGRGRATGCPGRKCRGPSCLKQVNLG